MALRFLPDFLKTGDPAIPVPAKAGNPPMGQELQPEPPKGKAEHPLPHRSAVGTGMVGAGVVGAGAGISGVR